jgi:copper(I)-binding protein
MPGSARHCSRLRCRELLTELCGLLCASAALCGCARPAAATAPIALGSAYVIEAGGQASSVDAYLVIRNAGAADHLLRVTSSAGGTIVLRGEPTAGLSSAPSISRLAIPAHRTIRLVPNGMHLVIVGSRRLTQGRYITLTLVFARAGAIRIPAQVTNLQGSGGDAGYNDNN